MTSPIVLPLANMALDLAIFSLRASGRAGKGLPRVGDGVEYVRDGLGEVRDLRGSDFSGLRRDFMVIIAVRIGGLQCAPTFSSLITLVRINYAPKRSREARE